MAINRKALDRAKIVAVWSDVQFDDEILETLRIWHGGQWSNVYAVHSSLYSGMPENLTKAHIWGAIAELEDDLTTAKARHYKGHKRDEIEMLKYTITMLNRVYERLPDDGSEDY